MDVSRRDLATLLPALGSLPKQSKDKADERRETLRSRVYQFEELPVHSSASGVTRSRPVFDGLTTRGQRVTLHITELAPGHEPHPPARQAHDEVIILREGTLEATLNGEKWKLGPGSVIFSAFNDLNGWRNVGTTPAQYFVLALEEHSG